MHARVHAMMLLLVLFAAFNNYHIQPIAQNEPLIFPALRHGTAAQGDDVQWGVVNSWR